VSYTVTIDRSSLVGANYSWSVVLTKDGAGLAAILFFSRAVPGINHKRFETTKLEFKDNNLTLSSGTLNPKIDRVQLARLI
jgi:hypothetical protein